MANILEPFALLVAFLTFRTTTSLVIQAASNEASPSSTVFRETLSGDSSTPHCWKPDPTYTPIPIYLQECRGSLQDVFELPLPDLPRIFSPNSYRDFDGESRLSTWVSGGCYIYVNSLRSQVYDQFSFADIWRTAKRIIDACVGHNIDRDGGWQSIGLSATGFYVGVGGTSPYSPAGFPKSILVNGTRGGANAIAQVS